MNEEEPYREAADAVEGLAERRRKPEPPAGRTDGSPVAPGGVPKADHVKNAEHAADVVEGPNAERGPV